jgi:hypothetical protein
VAVLYVEVREAVPAAAANGADNGGNGGGVGSGDVDSAGEEISAGAGDGGGGIGGGGGGGGGSGASGGGGGGLLGYFAVPVAALRGGVRSCALRDANGRKLPLAMLLVDFSIV